MKRTLSALYVFRFFRDFLIIAPVIIPFYRSNGLTATQILTVQAVFSASMLIFEVPSGYLSDCWGRKKTLFLGGLSIVSGFALYSFSSTVASFFAAEILLGFGFSMCSGTESALLYDTLSQAGRKEEYRKIESRAEFATRIGAAISSIAGGLLAGLGVRIPFYANTLSSSMLPLSTFFIKEVIREKPKHKNALYGIHEALVYCAHDRHIRSAAFLSGAVLTTGIISIWGYFLLLETIKFPLTLYGLVFFVYQSMSAAGARLSHWVTERTGRAGAIAIFLCVPLIFLFTGLLQAAVITALAFVQAFLWGLSTPFFLDIVNNRAKEELRATVLSTVSMGGRLLYVCAAPLFGLIVDGYGVHTGFVFLSVVFVAALIIAGLLLLRKEKSDCSVS